MSARNDGGPAFPVPQEWKHRPVSPPEPLPCEFHGMTLRDWFAGQALMGICANPEIDGTVQRLAEAAYGMADAMLAARDATGDGK